MFVTEPAENGSNSSAGNKGEVLIMVDIAFDIRTVKKKLSYLQENKSPGPDGLHPLILKRCAEVLAVLRAIIFRKSCRSGTVRDD